MLHAKVSLAIKVLTRDNINDCDSQFIQIIFLN